MRKIAMWFDPHLGQKLEMIDPPHHQATVLSIGRRLRRSCFDGDRSIRVKDEAGEYT